MPRVPIKPLLLAAFADRLPDFRACESKRGHWFRRKIDGVYELIVCGNAVSSGRIEFDVYAGVFPEWSGAYGSHLLSAGLRLDNLRYGTGALDVTLIGYRHEMEAGDFHPAGWRV